MSDELDDHSQPEIEGYNWQRIKDSRMDELIGICRGVLADGAVVIEEAKFIHDWLSRNKQVKHTLAGKMLHKLLAQILADDKLSEDEEGLLVEMLVKIIGGTPFESDDSSYSTTLPLDNPQPNIIFPGRSFCFTGKFQFGPRKQCQQITLSVGSVIHNNLTKSTNYLVIGEIGSRDWAHSNAGRKIEKAVKIRDSGSELCIISEAHWCASVTNAL